MFKIHNGREKDINVHSDWRYVFRRFEKQFVGYIEIYQTKRYYFSEEPNNISQSIYDMAEMRHRILQKIESNKGE